MSLAMSRAEREKFLADLHVGIVSIQREGRGPLAVPIWYDYEPGGKVWMITGLDSLKSRLLARTERISLCVQTEQAPYQYVSVEGAYSTRAVSDAENLSMAIRYLGEDQGRAYAAGSAGEHNIIVEFEPEHWLSVDYSKM